MTDPRPDWDTYYLGIAQAVSVRADCTRRKVGAVIVDQNDRPLGQGYNGAPPGKPGCLSMGACPRGRMSKTDILPGSSYDTGAGSCIAVHAEVNAILDAGGRRACLGATLYITDEPCDGCARIIEAAGIYRVVFPKESITSNASPSNLHSVIRENIAGYIDHELDTTFPLTYADDLAEQAGRLCYEAWQRKNPSTAINEGYLRNILDKGHFSVTEHSSASFYVDDVTRNFTHELIRHRHLSYSEVSQRYCDVEGFAFVEHPGLTDLGDEARKDLLAAIEAGCKAYRSIMKDCTDRGIEGKTARQAARHALLSGTETKIIVSGNMQAWRDMLWKRLDPTADAEFRNVVKEILLILKQIAPNTFQDFEVPV